MKSINHNELDEMPKMKGGNSKRGKKEPTTEWEKVKNFIGYGKIVSIIERSQRYE
jgi:hypothetical protein